MEYLIGLFLSLAVAGLVTIIGLDREPAFYPTVLIVFLILRIVCRDGSFWEGTHH